MYIPGSKIIIIGLIIIILSNQLTSFLRKASRLVSRNHLDPCTV